MNLNHNPYWTTIRTITYVLGMPIEEIPKLEIFNCSLVKDVYKLLCKGIEERKTVYSPLPNFLKNPNKESIKIYLIFIYYLF